MKLRVYFLIFIAALFLRLPVLKMLLAVGGYFVFEQIDMWRDRKFKDALYDELAWEQDPDDPTHELRDGLTRVRLPRDDQLIVTRIAELLRRHNG